ncbi:MAG: tetratricopeptide repeat protein, partial [Planctomycetales bacterium]|nr:tetratricopeptide repeat protein [Planctomycetales bacterium]
DDLSSPAAQQNGPRLPSLASGQATSNQRKGVFQQQSLSRQQVAQALSEQAKKNEEAAEKKPGAFSGLANGVKRIFRFGKKQEPNQTAPSQPGRAPFTLGQPSGVTPAAYNARISRANQTVINPQNTANKASQQTGRSGLAIRKGDRRQGLFDMARFGKAADEPPASSNLTQSSKPRRMPALASNAGKQAPPQSPRGSAGVAMQQQPTRPQSLGSKHAGSSVFKQAEKPGGAVFVSDMGQPQPAPNKQSPLPVVVTPPAATPVAASPLVTPIPAESPAMPLVSMPTISEPAESKFTQPSPLVVLNPQAMAPAKPAAQPAKPVAPVQAASQPSKPSSAMPASSQPSNLVLPNPVEVAAKTQNPKPVREATPRAAALLAEAHQLARTAEVEEQYTRVVQQCRHVLAIDDSPMAVKYSNELASWAMNKRGECKADQGREEEAMTDFTEAIHMSQACWRAHHNRGVLLAQAGQFADAFDAFNKTIELNPEFAKAFSNRASLYVQAGEFERSLADYKQAISLDPDLVVAHKGRGRVCHVLGQMEQALRHYDAAVLLEPSDPTVATCRADLLVDMGRYAQAAEAYSQAISLDPSEAIAHRNLAWLLATCPDNAYCDGQQALQHANKAIELTGQKDDISLDTLAAAQAATG